MKKKVEGSEKMKIKIDKEKSIEVLTDIAKKATDMRKEVVDAVQKNAQDFSEKQKVEAYNRRLKKYNPIFLEQFKSTAFNLPNVVKIVDDAVRRNIDVCEGAIGWLSDENGIEVLNLYDEAVFFSGIQFIPVATCDEVYYVDNFDKKKFIRVDTLFSRAQEERLAELKHIANSLGAKRCSIEIQDYQLNEENNKKKLNLKAGIDMGNKKAKLEESQEQELSSKVTICSTNTIVAEFEGSSIVSQPELKWFKHDENIKRLIEMRTISGNTVKKETLKLEGSASATMSQKVAISIDNALGKVANAKGTSNMEGQAKKENMRKLIFEIEF